MAEPGLSQPSRCPQCGGAIIQSGPGRRRKKCAECSPAPPKPFPKECAECGTITMRHKFCTDDCRMGWYKRNPRPYNAAYDEVRRRARGVRPIAEVNRERREAALRTCQECGDKFLKRNGTNAWAYCSRKCGARARERVRQVTIARREFAKWAKRAAVKPKQAKAVPVKQPVHCPVCASIVPQPRFGRKTYCSRKCHRATPAFREMRKAHRKRQKAAKRQVTVETVSPLKVFMRDGWRCHLCGGMTDKTKRGSLHPNAPELDHIVPLSKGGEHSYRNTACAHKRCNASKSDTILGQPSLLAA